MPQTKFFRSLYFFVLIAIVAGVVLGVVLPSTGVALKPLSDGFIRLIKMTIAPIIFCTVVVGIGGMKSMRNLGKAGGLAVLYFELVSSLSLVLGLLIVNVIKPGVGMHINPASLDPKAVADTVGSGKLQTVPEFLLGVIPTSFLDGLVKGEILQVLFVAILFGFALHAAGEQGKPVLELIERISHVMFRVVHMIMKVAPLGAFAAMAFTVGKYGIKSLTSLAELMACFYATCLLFVFGVLGAIAKAHKFSLWRFVRYIREELLIVLGTSSSEAALPSIMQKLERLGVSKPVVGLVVPAGYSFNLDGTSIYLTMAAVFVAQATDTPLDLYHQLGLLGVLLLTSKGAAGVTGSGFIVLGATLSAVGHVPVAGLALILGIDRFMSEARALTNLVGNGVATIVVGKWTQELDESVLQRELALREPSTDEPEAA
jgi:aerobic C4-dicarboxylate transport protein